MYYLYINSCITCTSTSVFSVYQQLIYLYIIRCIACTLTAVLPAYQQVYYLYINSCITCISTGVYQQLYVPCIFPGVLSEFCLYMQYVTCALGIHYLPQTVSGCWPPWWTLSWLMLQSLPPPSPVCGWWGALHWSSGCQMCLSGSAPVRRWVTAPGRRCLWSRCRGCEPPVWCWAAAQGHCWSGPEHTTWPPYDGSPSPSSALHRADRGGRGRGSGTTPPEWCHQVSLWSGGGSVGGRHSPEQPVQPSRAKQRVGDRPTMRTNGLSVQSRARHDDDDDGAGGGGGGGKRRSCGLMMSYWGDVQGRLFILLWTPEEISIRQSVN